MRLSYQGVSSGGPGRGLSSNARGAVMAI